MIHNKPIIFRGINIKGKFAFAPSGIFPWELTGHAILVAIAV